MSAIFFTSRNNEARLSGSERAYMGMLCSDIALAWRVGRRACIGCRHRPTAGSCAAHGAWVICAYGIGGRS